MNKLPAHHYIPQGYMKGFVNNNELYVINKKYGSVRPTAPAGIAYARGFYLVDTIDEKNSSEIEKNFSKIETACIPIIKKMIAGKYLTNSNVADLAIYIALQYSRTPFARSRMDEVATIVATNLTKEKLVEAYNNPEKYDEMAKLLQTRDPNYKVPSQDEIKDWVLKRGPLAHIKLDNGTYVKHFTKNSKNIAQGLLEKRWIVLRAPRGSSFITSDNPIGLHLPRDLQTGEVLAILLKDIQRFFPLNSKTCLAIIENDHFELKTSVVSKSQVKSINGLIYDQAYQYAISGIKPLLQAMEKRSS